MSERKSHPRKKQKGANGAHPKLIALVRALARSAAREYLAGQSGQSAEPGHPARGGDDEDSALRTVL